MLLPSLDLNIAFDLMSGVVALLVSYYAFRYTRLLENSVLRFLSLGFIMLGIGLLIEAAVFSLIVFNVGDLTTDRIFALGTAALYDILQIGAYFIFAFGYLRSALAGPKKSEAIGATAAIFALPAATSAGTERVREMIHLTRAIFAISEIFSVIFIAVVVFVGLLSYSETRHKFSLFVLASFVLILVAQAFELWTALSVSVRLDFVGSGIQFAGFASLLVFLIWSNKIGPARKAAQ
jgi:hypothetical protein